MLFVLVCEMRRPFPSLVIKMLSFCLFITQVVAVAVKDVTINKNMLYVVHPGAASRNNQISLSHLNFMFLDCAYVLTDRYARGDEVDVTAQGDMVAQTRLPAHSRERMLPYRFGFALCDECRGPCDEAGGL